MSLLTDVNSIITTLYPAATSVFSSKFNSNVKSFNVELAAMPLIVIDNELPKNNSIQKNSNILKDSKILISFLDLDNFGNTDEQSESIRSRMELMADRVAFNIYQLLPVRPSGNQKYKVTPMFHVYSSNLTGVALEMQVNYNEVINVSMPKLRFDTDKISWDIDKITFDYN